MNIRELIERLKALQEEKEKEGVRHAEVEVLMRNSQIAANVHSVFIGDNGNIVIAGDD